jgi:hypothetical protein
MQSGHDTEPELESFAGATAHWDAAKFGSWMRAGLDCWFHPSATAGLRTVAFRPLILNPDRDPVAQLIDSMEAIPGALERLRDAAAEALATWTGDAANAGEVLDALLRLGKRLPTAAHVPALRRLFFEGHLNDQPRKELLALEALETVLEHVSLSEGERLLRDLRRAECWRPYLAATWLEGMVRADKIDWFEGLRALRGDLEQVDPRGDDLRPMLRRMVNRAGGAYAVFQSLKSLGTPDSWLEWTLFGGERPPVDLTEIRDPTDKNRPVLALRVGEDIAPLYDDPPERDAIGTFYQIYSRRGLEPPQRERIPPLRVASARARRGRSPEQLRNILLGDTEFWTATTLQ